MTFAQFELTLSFLNSLRQCLELCPEFPIESTLINLINYSEGLEESGLESRIEEVEELVIAYLVHPVKRFVGNLIINRLAIRKELAFSNKGSTSNFLLRFLF